MKYEIIEPNDLDTIKFSDIFTAYAEEAKEAKINTGTLNLPKLMGHVFLALRDDSHVIYAARCKGEIVAILWGTLNEYLWCDESFAQDCMVYILKEHRGGLLAKRLVDCFERWAAIKGATSIHFGANSGIGDNAPASKLYSRLGYAQVGLSFRKNIGGD
jgi:GNAT superfamily N-acetyltransferase